MRVRRDSKLVPLTFVKIAECHVALKRYDLAMASYDKAVKGDRQLAESVTVQPPSCGSGGRDSIR